MRSRFYGVLLGFALATAHAQTSPVIAPGTYTAAQEGHSATGVDLVVTHVTPDGRITAQVREERRGPMCGMPLPANGRIHKDGVRIEVNDGAPEGCERVYVLQPSGDGSLSGEVIRGKTSAPIRFLRRG